MQKKTNRETAVSAFSQFIMDCGGKILPMHLFPIRLIKNYWGILKMKVYEGNWTAQTRDHLIRRIKMKQKEINQDIVIKMFDNLKGQVHVANENRLQSLMKF